MHLLPVSIVLYIYKPNLARREHEEQILRYEGSENMTEGELSHSSGPVVDINTSKREDYVKLS